MTVHSFASQSAVSDPGRHTPALDVLPRDLASIRRRSSELVFHYRAGGDWSTAGVEPERIAEIDTRYAEDMFERLLELSPSLGDPRPAHLRLVGCCRDFALLFVSMARHAGIPARSRVGFASYFLEGWYLDHVVAEVFDASQDRWRLVEAQVADGFEAAGDEPRLDLLDVPRDRFLTGPKAWLEARAGVREAERFVVDPDLDIPATRGWEYLRHNLLHDLAALAKTEMVLWDAWGAMEEPLPADHTAFAARRQLDELDHVARLIADPDCPVENIEDWAGRDGLRPAETITSYSPASAEPLRVDVRRAIGRPLSS